MVGPLSYLQSHFTIPRVVGIAFVLAIGLTAFASVSLVTAQRGEQGDPPLTENFQGCVNNYTGVLRIIAEDEQCAEHEMPIQLNSGADSDDLLARIEALEQQNIDQQAEIDTLTQQNTDQQTTINNLTTENQSQQATITTLTTENQTQQTTIDNLTTENGTQQDEIDALELRVNALEANPVTLPACLTTEAVDGQAIDDIVFNGCNVHVRDGSGDTGGTPIGLGNLIVGYNEDNGDTRTGSHNLVVGRYHTYTSFGGFVAGSNSAINGLSSSVSGGEHNTASGDYSIVSGGEHNTAAGKYSSISGGYRNTASGTSSSISGGEQSTTNGQYSSISGGYDNTASGTSSSVSGGEQNTAAGNYSSVNGGFQNTANGLHSAIGGGASETVDGESDWAAGDLYFTSQ